MNDKGDVERYDHLFKSRNIKQLVILAGDTSVGKTQLVQSFNKSNQSQVGKQTSNNPGKFANIPPTIGVQFSTKIVTLANHKKIKVQIWDTAGQEQYRSITTAHYRKALGALVVYDITKQKTFQDVKIWIQAIREQADPNIVIYLIANKIDQRANEQVKSADARKYANKQMLGFQQTSALTDNNVYETFLKVIEQIYKRQAEKQAKNQDPYKQGQRFVIQNQKNTSNQKCQC